VYVPDCSITALLMHYIIRLPQTEKMDIIPFDSIISLQAHTGNNLQNCNREPRCLADKKKDSGEKLRIVRTDDGKVVIQSVLDGNNLQVQPSGRCIFANKNMLLWEKFDVEADSSGNFIHFISCHTGNVLQCNEYSGIVSCSNKNRLSWETWKIIILPINTADSLSTRKSKSTASTIAAVTGGTAGAVAGASACSATISGLGFTSTGIAAGSTAAAMMSAEAIAAGGGVAAGGAVATLQSIGVLGIFGGGGLGFLLFASSAVIVGGLGAGLAYGLSQRCGQAATESALTSTGVRKNGLKYNKWIVVAEEGIGNILCYTFSTEEDALALFRNHGIIARILLDPFGIEVTSAGWNRFALNSIRNYVKNSISKMSGGIVTSAYSPGDVVRLYSITERRFVYMWGDYVGAGDLGKTPNSKNMSLEEFTVVDAGQEEIAFHCNAQNRFLRLFAEDVDGKGGEKALTELPVEWGSERFSLVDAGNGKLVLMFCVFILFLINFQQSPIKNNFLLVFPLL